MISKQIIRKVIEDQYINIHQRNNGIRREVLTSMPYLTNQALLITGPYRSGRSTAMLQLMNEDYPEAWYVNFEDPRLYGFDNEDFKKLDDLITESGKGVLFFDKIDTIKEWPDYVARKVDEEFKVVATVTLSPQSQLLQQEPLKNKTITRTVYPFSFKEYLSTTHKNASENTLTEYMYRGGFPDNIVSWNNGANTNQENVIRKLFTDSLNREVIIKNGIRDIHTLRRIANHLLNNCAEMISANKIRNMLAIKAVSTVTEHFGHLEEAYIAEFVPRLAPKAQQNVNPRRVFITDTSLPVQIATEDNSLKERLFTNLIYLHLRRKYREIYYYADNDMCDFIAYDNGEPHEVVQVAMVLDHDNFRSKVDATLAALKHTGLKKGCIITLDREEFLDFDDVVIEVIEAHNYLMH